jgi:hypothetical protein
MLIVRDSNTIYDSVYIVDGDNVGRIPKGLEIVLDKSMIVYVHNGANVVKYKAHPNLYMVLSTTLGKGVVDIAISSLATHLHHKVNKSATFYIVTKDHFADELINWIPERKCVWLRPCSMGRHLQQLEFIKSMKTMEKGSDLIDMGTIEMTSVYENPTPTETLIDINDVPVVESRKPRYTWQCNIL